MRVSVIVATYGSAEWQQRGLEAVRAVQRHPGVLEAFAHHEWGGTLATARTAASYRATGDWLCFLDADDDLRPDYFQQMELAEYASAWRATPRLLVPGVARVHQDSPTSYSLTGAGIPAWDAPLIDLNCAVIGTLIPTSLFRSLGGFRDTLPGGTPLPSLEDWELWLRAVRAGAVMVPVPNAVYFARTGGLRNLDQSPYQAVRDVHGPGFDWWNTPAYKAA